MFRDQKQSPPKATRAATEDSTFHPLPALFKVIGITPFMKVSGLQFVASLKDVLIKDEKVIHKIMITLNAVHAGMIACKTV